MPKEVERISDEKLDEVTENLLAECRRAGGDAACIKGVASITDIFVELRESRSLLREMEHNQLEEHETWTLEFSYGSPGISLGSSYTPCNSLEECKAQFEYMVEHCGMPRWAQAVHSIEKVMVKTIVFKLIDPPSEYDEEKP